MPGLHQELSLEKAEVDSTLCARWKAVVKQIPERPALRGECEELSFSQLDEVCRGLAGEVLRRTSGNRGCIALLVPQDESMVIGALSILLSGQALLGLHPGQPDQILREIAENAEPLLLLCHPDLTERAASLNLSCPIIPLVPVDEEALTPPPVEPSDPCVIFYTSGSTGKPKGVVKSHRAVMHRVWLGAVHDQIGPGDRASLLTHLSFASAEADVFATLLLGGCVCPFDVASRGLSALQDWLRRERISLFHPPVVLFREFLRSLPDTAGFPEVRLVALAGDLVLQDDLNLWRAHFSSKCELRHRYSSTETALITVAHLNSNESELHCGRPVQDKVVEVLAPEGPQVLGEVGEILVKSSYLATGYWNNFIDSEAAFQPTSQAGETLYRTGDLGFFDKEGRLHYVGRQDDQVKVRGFRLNCREVEAALLQLEGVKEAAVLVDRSGREPELVAQVHMEQGQPCLQSLRRRLQELLPEWKIPTRLSTEDPLPKTLTGKIDKTAIRRNSPHQVERELELLWLSLERPPVSAQDDLLLFGGDSITIVLLLHEIEQKFQVAITPREFFEKRTLEHLATLIKQRRKKEPETLPTPEAEPVPDTPSSDLQEWTVADGFLALLSEFGIKYLFLNPGTDSAPLLESVVKFKQKGLTAPEVVLCLHESVAMSCAHGYFMVSGQVQMVFVHVDLGTLNVGGSLHNAQRGRAGIVLVAGRSPYTLEGQAASRDRYAHWIQEQRDQTGAVRNFVKWDYTLPCPQNLVPALEKAFQAAAASPEGPVYLTLPREVFMAGLPSKPRRARLTSRSRKAPDPELIQEIATRILAARFPLLLASRSGSRPETVDLLVELSELAAIAVVESRHRLNFPHSHPHHLGFSPNQFLNDADVVLALDHDVPWIPRQWQPTEDCCIVQVDSDTQKLNIPIWGFPVDISVEAEPLSFLRALIEEIRGKLKPHHQEHFQRRHRQLTETHQTLRQRWERVAVARSNESPLAPPWFGYCLNQLMDEKTTIVCDAATNNPVLWTYLQSDHPAGFYQSLGSSLGWGLGAAVGAKMATPERTVIAVVGDGGWMFSNPLVVYQLAQRQNAPFLTIVLNNEKYAAISEAVQSLVPEGEARRNQEFSACELPKPGYYARIGEAAGLWSRVVRQPDKLQETLRQALAQVQRGQCALVELWVSSPNP